MPELPEVYTISQDLKKNILGYKVTGIQINRDYKIPNDVKIKLKNLIGKEIQDSDRIAKNIVLKISDNEFLVFHLAMTGRILLREYKDEKDNWVKVVFEITKNDKTYFLKFCDMRQFGKIRVVDKTSLDQYSNKYGLDVISQKISAQNFLKSLSSKKTSLKNALMDQKIISGMGNIYATDALFLSNLNPKTSTQNISLEDAEKLLKFSKEILNEGIKNRGSTLPDKMYVDIFGKSGSQQDHFKIYGKKVCQTCGSKVEFEKINGRGTYFCPTCQPVINSSLEKNKKVSKQKNLL